MTDEQSIPSSHRPMGYDEDSPYEDEDMSSYPDWWREGIESFSEHGLRPYRPPRFEDGTYTPELIDSLESELAVEIRFQSLNPQETDCWDIVVDDSVVGTVERYRSQEGYTVYDMPSDEFETVIRAAVES